MKKLLAFIVCVNMILALMIPSFADRSDIENPFSDIAEGKWYTESVLWCYKNGYMAGDSENTFSPGKGMTRAMIVTVFAAVAGADTSLNEFEHSGFDDVPDGKWYTRTVSWAAKVGVTSGMSENRFSPNTTVTREQFVLMLSKLLQYLGTDTTYKGGHAFDVFGDKGTASGWAETALRWASENELISGVGSENGSPKLSPKGTVTRAQAAVFIKSALEKNLGGEYPVGSISLGGADISDFTVIYGSDFNQKLRENMKENAEFFVNVVKNACGVQLEMYKDSEVPAVEGAKEILIGITDRESSGLITVDRSGFTNPAYIYEMRDNYLVLTCPENLTGAAMAVSRFLEDVCGVTYYGCGIFSYTSMKSASIENGTRVEKEAAFYNGWSYFSHGDDNFIGTPGGDRAMLNLSHSLPVLCCPGCEYGQYPTSDHHVYHYMSGEPCLSDPEVIDTVIKNVGWILERSLGENKDWDVYIHVSQSDGAKYCKCDRCREIYRIWGRGATYTMIMKYVSDAYSAEYPNLKYLAYGCDMTAKRPKLGSEITDEAYQEYLNKYGDLKYVPDKDITPPDNCVLQLKTDTSCESHKMTDPNCPRNAAYIQNVYGWCEMYNSIIFNSFSGSKYYIHNPFPDIYELHDTFGFFSGLKNYTGYRVFGFSHGSADFRDLHVFLVSRLTWDPRMTMDEYLSLVDKYLKTVYGPGWQYIREDIDLFEELSSENHFWTYEGRGDEWNMIVREDQWRADDNYEYCADLFRKALELCDNDSQKYEVRKAYAPIRYVGCQLAYSAYEKSGEQSDLDVFSEFSTEYYNELRELGLEYPENWNPTLDPDNWIND